MSHLEIDWGSMCTPISADIILTLNNCFIAVQLRLVPGRKGLRMALGDVPSWVAFQDKEKVEVRHFSSSVHASILHMLSNKSLRCNSMVCMSVSLESLLVLQLASSPLGDDIGSPHSSSNSKCVRQQRNSKIVNMHAACHLRPIMTSVWLSRGL